MDMNSLAELQAWYVAQCDGDWEHAYAVQVETLDNPGWMLKIDVRDTSLEGVPFEEVMDNYDHERDWMRCWLEGDVFKGACGPLRLEDMIRVFLDWSASSNKPMQTDGASCRR